MNVDLRSYVDQIKTEGDIFLRAKLLHDLVYIKNIRIVEVARELGKTPSYICHLLRLADLPDSIVDGYYNKLISLSHLFILSRIKDKKKLLEIYEQILTGNYTVARTDELVREILFDIKSKGQRLSKVELQGFIDGIKKHNNDLDIKIVQTRIKGKAVLEIKGNLEETTALLKRLLTRLSQ